jgi:hypothetical protein
VEIVQWWVEVEDADLVRVRLGLMDAYRAAGRAVARKGNNRTGFDAATWLVALFDELARDAAQARAVIAYEMWRAGRLTYTELGGLLGVRKSRAEQLVKIGREAYGRGAVLPPPVEVPAPAPVAPVSAPPPPPIAVPTPAVPEVATEQRPRRAKTKAAPVDFSSPDWRDAVRAAAVPRESDRS